MYRNSRDLYICSNHLKISAEPFKVCNSYDGYGFEHMYMLIDGDTYKMITGLVRLSETLNEPFVRNLIEWSIPMYVESTTDVRGMLLRMSSFAIKGDKKQNFIDDMYISYPKVVEMFCMEHSADVDISVGIFNSKDESLRKICGFDAVAELYNGMSNPLKTVLDSKPGKFFVHREYSMCFESKGSERVSVNKFLIGFCPDYETNIDSYYIILMIQGNTEEVDKLTEYIFDKKDNQLYI